VACDTLGTLECPFDPLQIQMVMHSIHIISISAASTEHTCQPPPRPLDSGLGVEAPDEHA